jgi:hypothetical protein
MNEAQSLEPSGITAWMLLGLPLIPLATLAISEVYLWLYRRAVVQAMAAQRQSSGATATAPAPAPALAGQVALAVRSVDRDSGSDSAGGGLYQRFLRARKTTAAVYVAAGLVYAGLMAIAFGMQYGTLSFPEWLAFSVAFAWPAVLSALLFNPPRRRRWRAAIVIGYLVVFFLGTLVPTAGWFLFGIFMANVGATIVSMVVRARRIHAVAPLIGAVLTIGGATLLVLLAVTVFVGDNPAQPDGEMETGAAFLFLGVLLVVMATGPLTAWFTLRTVAARYGRKSTSDQAVAMSAFWLTFAGIQSTTFAFVDARWIIAGLVIFLVFAAAATTGFWLVRRRTTIGHRAPRLLVLRVFALGRRSRKLFDQFATLWRHVGSVQLIAGPDLASSTVEPHEFLDFLRRRLGDRFLDSDESIAGALARLDTDPDPDGRYRITDFICRDHAWRTVFGRLAAESDVVLMDLRGFSTANAGCVYELGALLDVVPIERVTIIVNQSTDEDFLLRTLEQAKASLHVSSPNIAIPVLRVPVFRETGRRGLDPDQLVRLLCEAAALSRREQVVAHAG